MRTQMRSHSTPCECFGVAGAGAAVHNRPRLFLPSRAPCRQAGDAQCVSMQILTERLADRFRKSYAGPLFALAYDVQGESAPVVP